MSGPLTGLRIVEMVGIGPCPFAAMMLADMGAEVIRIDRKPHAGSASTYPMFGTSFDVMARGRRSLALDLKQAEARELALDLIAHADAVIEGFRPGVMERLGLAPDVCMAPQPGADFWPYHRMGPDWPAVRRGGSRSELPRDERTAPRHGSQRFAAVTADEPHRRLWRRRHDARIRRGVCVARSASIGLRGKSSIPPWPKAPRYSAP